MMILPRTDWGMTLALLAVPAVGLFVWAFNSYKLGRFPKFKFSRGEKNLKQEDDSRKHHGVLLHIIVILSILFLLLRD